jgi:hypothetical protein
MIKLLVLEEIELDQSQVIGEKTIIQTNSYNALIKKHVWAILNLSGIKSESVPKVIKVIYAQIAGLSGVKLHLLLLNALSVLQLSLMH